MCQQHRKSSFLHLACNVTRHYGSRALILLSFSFFAAGTATADTSLITVQPGEATVSGTASETLEFTLQRSGDTNYEAWLRYNTVDDSAHMGTDYIGEIGQLRLPKGQATVILPITVTGSSSPSVDKTFSLELKSALGTGPAAEFRSHKDFNLPRGPNEVVSVDLNSDGKIDILTLHNSEDVVSIRLNTTAVGADLPTFSNYTSFSTELSPNALEVADINSDGLPDMVVANWGVGSDDTVAIRLNTTLPGANIPTFTSRIIVSIGTGKIPRGIKAADINNDGLPDLITANRGSDDVSVLLNKTAPGSTAPQFSNVANFSVASAPSHIVAADINSDGQLDLVTTSTGLSRISILLNKTAPGATVPVFATSYNLVLGIQPEDIAAADLNNDGLIDLIASHRWADTDYVSVLLNETQPDATLPDFSSFTSFDVGTNPFSVAATDVNGDGKTDLISANGASDNVSILINTTAPGAAAATFAANIEFDAQNGPIDLTTGDVNSDGRADLIMASYMSDNISVLLNMTPATGAAWSFAAKQDFSTGSAPYTVATVDINNDGLTDLVTANSGDNNVSVLLNKTVPGATTPLFAARTEFSTGTSPEGVTATDINGDGLPDLVTANSGSNNISILISTTSPGNTTPTFTTKTNFTTGNGPEAVTAADINSDGLPDLITSNNAGNSVSVLLNTTAPGATSPAFSAKSDFNTDNSPRDVAVTDVNSDGLPDVVTANWSGSVSVLINTTTPGATTPTFSTNTDFDAGALAYSITVVDVNSDNRPDLVTDSSGSPYSVSVLLNKTEPGATAPDFTIKTDFPIGGLSLSVTAEDVNLDGLPDLIAANYADKSISFLINTTAPGAATPTFATSQDISTGVNSEAITTADVNSDGLPDLVTANSTDNISVLLNTQFAVSLTPASVTGTIHYKMPVAEILPSSLDFGSQPRASGSAVDMLTLTNTGNADLDITNLTLGGIAATDYAQSNNCPTSLPPITGSNSCTITITFTPTKDGTRNATLTLVSDAPDSPLIISLTGNGVNIAPVASNLNLSTDENQPVNGTLHASDTNGDTLSFSVAEPAHGSVSVTAATGAFTYTPDADYSGTDSFTFTASDGALVSDTATVHLTIEPKQTPPDTPRDNEENDGGGALGWLGLFLLSYLTFWRYR